MILLPDFPIHSGKADNLLKKAAYAFHGLRLLVGTVPPYDPIFVVGSGRSGTHWLGKILESHPELKALIEKPPHFVWVMEMAIDPRSQARLFDKLVRRYRIECLQAAPRRLVDKSHPNIWLAEDLAASFPGGQFVGIVRDAFGTVSSMLRHEGVMFWIENWTKYPVPNRFLGITRENREWYESLSTAGKCAVRWRAHHRRLDDLKTSLGKRFLLIDYSTLQEKVNAELRRLQRFLNLMLTFATPEIRKDSLRQWEGHLTKIQVAEIERVIAD